MESTSHFLCLGDQGTRFTDLTFLLTSRHSRCHSNHGSRSFSFWPGYLNYTISRLRLCVRLILLSLVRIRSVLDLVRITFMGLDSIKGNVFARPPPPPTPLFLFVPFILFYILLLNKVQSITNWLLKMSFLKKTTTNKQTSRLLF